VEGTGTDWFLAIHPYVSSYTLRGIRNGTSVCGDGQRDPDEACDFGAVNGLQQCCSTSCTFVDPDGDGTCDDLDPCPDAAYQSSTTCEGVEPFEILSRSSRYNAADTLTIKFIAAIKGQEITFVDGIPHLGVFLADVPWLSIDDLVCTKASTHRMKCVSGDGTKTITLLSRSTGAKMKAALRNCPPAGVSPQFSFGFTDSFGLKRGLW
jgi:hypothetical protein